MDIFKTFQKFVKPDKVCIDNKIFRLCTKVTFVILCGFSILVTSNQYIGDPIHCIVDVIPKKVMDTYCWFYSTYTLSNHLNGIVGKDIVQPGVAADSVLNDIIIYHRYYQWVCFMLFFQGICSFFPRYLWKSFENGRIKMLSGDIKQPFVDGTTENKQKRALITYIKDNLNKHSFYAWRFFLCELLNFLIAIGQIYVTDLFLGGEFITYGIDVMRENEADPMTRIFPKMTKCSFYKYGPSGSVQNFDGLCVLPVNIVNEKIYLFLWFWFYGVSILSGIALIYRILVCCSSSFRLHLLRARARLTSQRDIEFILYRFKIGDWFLLYQLSKNLDPFTFKEICRDLSHELYSNDY